MTATLTMVPLTKITARRGFNPRSDFADEQMAELIESARRHGVITPLTLAPDGEGRITIIAGSAATGPRRPRSSARCPPRCARPTARR